MTRLILTGLDMDLLNKVQNRWSSAKRRRRSSVQISPLDRARLYRLAGMSEAVKIDENIKVMKLDLAEALLNSIRARVRAAERYEKKEQKTDVD